MLQKIAAFLTPPPSPIVRKRDLVRALIISPIIWLGWAWRTLWRIAFAVANGRVAGARSPQQPIKLPLPPRLFGTKEPYEVYKDTRERLWDQVKQRGERQWTLMTWAVGLLTAIIGGLLVFAADGKDLPSPVKLAVGVWVAFIALFALVRILHDQIIADYHGKACQQMDLVFGLHFDDRSHKIDMKLHHFFMVIILLLSLGSLSLIALYDEIKSPEKPEARCPCCGVACGEAKPPAPEKYQEEKHGQEGDGTAATTPAPQPPAAPAPAPRKPLMLTGNFSAPHLQLRALLTDNFLESLLRSPKSKTTIDVMYGSPSSVTQTGDLTTATYNLAIHDEDLRREGGRVGFVGTFKEGILQSWSPISQDPVGQ